MITLFASLWQPLLALATKYLFAASLCRKPQASPDESRREERALSPVRANIRPATASISASTADTGSPEGMDITDCSGCGRGHGFFVQSGGGSTGGGGRGREGVEGAWKKVQGSDHRNGWRHGEHGINPRCRSIMSGEGEGGDGWVRGR